MRLAPISLGIIAMFGMIAAATGCHSSAPAPATFSPLDQADKYQWLEDIVMFVFLSPAAPGTGAQKQPPYSPHLHRWIPV
jgi:hypothetical protein